MCPHKPQVQRAKQDVGRLAGAVPEFVQNPAGHLDPHAHGRKAQSSPAAYRYWKVGQCSGSTIVSELGVIQTDWIKHVGAASVHWNLSQCCT